MDWQAFYRHHPEPDLEALGRFAPWQEELAAMISHLSGARGRVLEAGSGYGQTGYLVAASGERSVTLLDLYGPPLQAADRLFARGGLRANLVQGDLLALPFGEAGFDVVFNAGVLEHFRFAQRCRILAEMVRCVRPGGRVVVAVPNHFSRPYRYSYCYRKSRGQWSYPDELMIRDFTREVQEMGMAVEQECITLDRETAYHFLRRHQRIVFRLLAVFRPHQGYLRVVILRRVGEQAP